MKTTKNTKKGFFSLNSIRSRYAAVLMMVLAASGAACVGETTCVDGDNCAENGINEATGTQESAVGEEVGILYGTATGQNFASKTVILRKKSLIRKIDRRLLSGGLIGTSLAANTAPAPATSLSNTNALAVDQLQFVPQRQPGSNLLRGGGLAGGLLDPGVFKENVLKYAFGEGNPRVVKPVVTIGCRFAPSGNFGASEEDAFFDALMGDKYPGMNHYFKKVSHGALSLDGSRALTGYDLPKSRAEYFSGGQLDHVGLIKDCLEMADPEVYFPDYAGISIVLNENLDDFAYGGFYKLDYDGQLVEKKSVTLMSPAGYRNASVVARSLGYAFGLERSASWNAGPSVADSHWDVASGAGSCESGLEAALGCRPIQPTAYNKDLAGWLTPGSKAVHTTARATYTLSPVEDIILGSDEKKLVRIPINDAEFFTIEARKKEAANATSTDYAKDIPGSGVLIHHYDKNRADPIKLRLIDADRNVNPNDGTSAWQAGYVYSDARTTTSIAVRQQKPDGSYVVDVARSQPLKVEVSNARRGQGWVSGDNSCQAPCTGEENIQKRITLTAHAPTGTTFHAWVGCNLIYANTCEVTMDGARTVTAIFTGDMTACKRACLESCGAGNDPVTKDGLKCGTQCANECR